MYYAGFTYTEAYNLPVEYKRWYIERLMKELKGKSDDPNDNSTQATRALHQNSPDVRAMQGMTRTQTPSRLRRFT